MHKRYHKLSILCALLLGRACLLMLLGRSCLLGGAYEFKFFFVFVQTPKE